MTRRTALRWSGYIAFAVAFAIACAYLANWQFTRNESRENQLALIAANYDAAPAALDEVLPPGAPFDAADEWQPVILVGEYLPDETVLARNRPHGGTSAFEVLVPFATDDGRVVLVNRGWVPPASDSSDPDAVPTPPTGEVSVTVRLRPAEPLPTSGRSAPDGQVPTITPSLLGDGVLPDVYAIMVAEDPAPASAPQPLESPSEDPGPHLSYAIQWILFAVMGFAFIWYMIRTEIRHRREDADEAAGGEAAASVRLRRERDRRDRDMQDEDALVEELAPR